MPDKQFIDVERLIASKNPKLLKRLPGFFIRYLKRILHQDEVNEFIKENGHLHGLDFCDAVIKDFKISYEVDGIENIPKEGKIVIVMNHPLGGMDALILISALRNHREDLQFIVNDLLMNLENLREFFVGVDKHGRAGLSLKQRIDELFKSDKAICIFPAGMVSRYFQGKIQDFEWKKTFVKYAKQNGQDIIPVYIDGKLSRFFYNLYRFRKFIGVNTNIEMLYLANEMYKQRNQKLRFVIGEAIPNDQLKNFTNDHEAAQEIRKITYNLKEKV
jgi:putative hemolysin